MNQTDNADYSPKEVATFVWFEYTMFDQVFKEIQSLLGPKQRADSQGGVQPKTSPKQFAKNILLASFLLHTRNLRNFLFYPRSQDDVIAKDFLDGWNEKVENWCPYLDANRDRLNKSLAHISYKRVEYEANKQWEYVEIHKELTDAWDAFWDRLRPEQREWFTRDRDRQQGVKRL